MKRIIPQIYRYPLFFTGLIMLVIAGLLNKYFHMGVGATAIMALIGFGIFVLSIIA